MVSIVQDYGGYKITVMQFESFKTTTYRGVCTKEDAVIQTDMFNEIDDAISQCYIMVAIANKHGTKI